jgi:hypothetical protein
VSSLSGGILPAISQRELLDRQRLILARVGLHDRHKLLLDPLGPDEASFRGSRDRAAETFTAYFTGV